MTIGTKNRTKRGLLTGVNLCTSDAERLVLECIERMGEKSQGLDRNETINLVRRVIEEGVRAVEACERTRSFGEVGWKSIEARQDCRKSTLRDLRYYLRKMLKLEGIEQLPLRSITCAQCREILQRAFGHSKSLYIKGRAVLHSIFAYGVRQEWCDINPVSRIEIPKVQETPKEPLTIEEVERLVKTAEQPQFRDMKLSLNLLLYSGIRPTEVSRLKEDDFCWIENSVIIRPQKSKTGGGRIVPMRHPSRMRKEDRIIPRGWTKKWKALRHAAGFSNWIPDICRHTFASYHATHFRDLPGLQLEMGHRDVNLLRTRYISPTLQETARRFWKK